MIGRGFVAYAAAACLWWAAAAENSSVEVDSESRPCDGPGGWVGKCGVAPQVDTVNGPVIGYTQQDKSTSQRPVSSYLGIPFAEPPVGENRFKAPKPYARNWTKPLKAIKRANICYQWPVYIPFFGSGKQDEDCLYLNVYTPSGAIGRHRKKLPVMIWIFGGAFIFGDGYETILNQAVYDGAALAGRHKVVVVTMNYRLNAFGHFASDALKAEDPNGSTGNMGLLDQRMAMEWVHRNIDGFGGDPNKVTLFGESAGAFSIVWHLVSKPSWPLFNRAILESSTTAASWFFQPYNDSTEMYREWSAKVGCPTDGKEQLDCMRKIEPSKLIVPPADLALAPPTYDPTMKAMLSFTVGPVIDGSPVGLMDVPLTLMRKGEFHKVPLLAGANKDDGSIFEIVITTVVPSLNPPTIYSKKGLDKALEWTYGKEQVEMIEGAYPPDEFSKGQPLGLPNWSAMFSRMIRDLFFQCSDRELARAWQAHGVPIYLYTFSFNLGVIDKLSGLGNLHGSEILFVFRKFLWLPQILAIKNAQKMADLVSCKWTTFAHTASPDGQGPESWPPNCKDIHPNVASWPAYDGENRQYYSLEYPPRANVMRTNNSWPDDEFPSDARCDVLAQLNFPWRRQPPPESTVYV